MVPLMDCLRQYAELRAEHDAAIARVVQSGWYILGEEVRRFEKAFAAYCGVEHAVGVANGTDALELALRVVGCGRDSEVIMAANAGMYAAVATVQLQATPVFADIESATLLISPTSVARLIGPQTRAIVATHLHGRLAKVHALRELIGQRPIALIEDAAQAHGAGDAAGRAGSFGDLATFSFYPTKNLGALGDGGAVVTRDAVQAQAVRELAQYGWTRRYEATRPGGRNSRLDELQAAVLNVRLPYLDRWNERRREVVRRYREAAQASGLTWLSAPIATDVCHLCTVRHPQREAIRHQLEQAGIATGIHYPHLDVDQPALAQVPWRADDLTCSRSAQAELFTLPCFAQMTEAEIAHTCHTLSQLKIASH